jgi:biotin carboxylase
MSTPCIGIVDPFSAGSTLAEELRARSVRCIAILSAPGLPEILMRSFRPELFEAVIEHAGDAGETAARVAPFQPAHVVVGFESGVELADSIAESLGLAGNGTALSAARRNKSRMAETVRARGLATPAELEGTDPDELAQAVQSGLDLPVIVKPDASIASDEVTLCRSIDEVRSAAERILGNDNFLGRPNACVLAQEYIQGIEYVVDSVSWGGRHKVCALWQYHRPDDGSDFVCYDSMELIPFGGDRQAALCAAALRALDALGVSFGPAHCELMWTGGRAVFIELGARLTAGINATLGRECASTSQLDEFIRVLLEPELFVARADDAPILFKRATNVFLMPRREGRLVEARGLERIEALATLHKLSFGVKPGEPLPRVAGLVTLVSEDRLAIERDVNLIRELERGGLYQTEATA